ncbi:ESPR-type extended signal peptide-containing protein, partial [Mannheimia sp. HC-2023]|uniref:ESPR-type extended signal peptide-containing protein n=1 Tax=Mannheimia indoligenes TaxID=3103145 RepID=UPI002FE593CF
MNKIFKIVFNKETGVFTAVAEFAKAQGKSSSCTVGSKSSRFVAQTFTLTALAAGMMLSSSVWAYSSLNGRVTGGDADKTLAMMDNAVVQASEGIAIGNSATSYSNATGQSAQNVAIGHEAKAITGAVAIGYQANTLNSSQQKGTNQQSVAIGYQTVASGDQSTALGAQSKAAGNSSVAIGGDDLDKVASSRPPAWDDQTFSAEEAKGLNNTAAAKKYEQLTGDILVHFENSLVRGNQVTRTPGMPNRYTGTEAGEGSVAVGVQSQAKGALATAFGTRTSASGTASVALGVGALATNDGSFAGAAGAQSTGISSIALGTGSKAQGNQSLAMGDSAQATTDSAYAIGTEANATAISAISIGRETNATKENAVALSRLANATGEAANAIGFRSEAHGTNSVALGTQAVVTAGALAGVAIGEKANASNTKSIAIGAASKSSGDKSIAVGDQANATSEHSFAMGGQSAATNRFATAVGSNSAVSGEFGTAVGKSASVSGRMGSAFGTDSKASGESSTAVGRAANATGSSAIAMGSGANATNNNAIATGTSSTAAASSSIAIGNEANVASAAVNSIAMGYKASSTQQNSVSLGREATTASNYSTALGANANVGANLAGAVALGNHATAQAGVSTNEATVNGITYSGFAGNKITHNTGTESYVVSVGDANTKRQIQNVAAGQITKTSTDAINGSQLYMVADEVAKSREKVTSNDKTVTVKESKDDSGSTVFDLSIKKAAPTTNTDGKVQPIQQDGDTSFVTGDTLVNTINAAGFNVAGNGTKTNELVNPGDTVDFVDGKGTTAVVEVKDGKNTIKYDIKVDDETIKVGDDGKLTVINNNAEDTNDIAKVVAGDNIQVDAKTEGNTTTFTVATKKDLVVDSVKAGDTTINNDGLKVGDVTVTNSPITVNGNTVNNINDAINQTAEQAFKPLTFGGDKGNDVTRKLGEKVNVKGGATGELSSGNIAVEADGTDTLNIKLAKELKDINSITINNGPTINNNGINMDGDKITNLKDGEDDGDAVNVKQLKESKETVISKDNSIKVTTGKNANGANEFDLSVNKTELKDENNDGKVDAPSNEDGDKLVDAKTVADAINNSGFKLTTSASKGEVVGTTEELINPGDIVTIDAGNNIKVTQDKGKITVETKDNVTFGEKGEDGKPG